MKGREVANGMGGMTKGSFLLVLVLSLSLFPVPPVMGERLSDSSADPHSYFMNPASCPRCHVYRGSGREKGRFLPGADTFCLDCHSLEGLGTSHPIAIRPGAGDPGMRVPAELPLDSEGKIFCLTCHNAHGPFLSSNRSFAAQKAANTGAPAGSEPAYRTYFVRRSDPVRGFAPLCEECHGKR
jgi:hypothetical protein